MFVTETETPQGEVLWERAGAIEWIEVGREVSDVSVVVDERVDFSLQGMRDLRFTHFPAGAAEFKTFKESLPVDVDRGRVRLPLAVILFHEIGVPAVQ